MIPFALPLASSRVTRNRRLKAVGVAVMPTTLLLTGGAQ
jgi:hypothetical protein